MASYDVASNICQALRHGEARVWDIYRRILPAGAMDGYADYARGFNLTNRMPLFVTPTEKQSVSSVMVGPARYCSPRHRMPFNLGNEG